jgi:hypothetical protein
LDPLQPHWGKFAYSLEHRFLSILAKTLPPATIGFGWAETISARLLMAFFISLPNCPKNHYENGYGVIEQKSFAK